MDDGEGVPKQRRAARASGEAGAGAKPAKRSMRKGPARPPRHGQEVIVPLRARHDGWTPIRQRAFLRALSELGSVRDACTVIGLSNTSAYRLRTLSPEFAAAWDKALEIVAPILEQAAFERGVDGWDEPIFYQGEICGYKRRYSDHALRLLMQRRASAGGAGPDPAGKTQAELVSIARKAALRAGGNFYPKATSAETDAALVKKLIAIEKRGDGARRAAEARGEVWLAQGCYPPDITVREAAALAPDDHAQPSST